MLAVIRLTISCAMHCRSRRSTSGVLLEGLDRPVACSTMTNVDLRHLLGTKAAQ